MTWFLFLLIWIVFVGLNVLGTATLLHTLRRQHPKKFTSFVRHGVSVLKPLKGVDPSLRENLESFFNLVSNVPHELLFSLENERDEAYALVLSLLDQYPSVPARVFILENAKTLDRGLNPKLKNLSQSYDECAFDLVLISDSNVRVPPTLLCTLIQEMDSSTGLVTAIVAGQAPRGMGGILEAMYLNTFYARFMALSNRFAKPCVVGKMMMFRKSTASRFGGIRILSQFLAEDFMAGESFQKLGLKIATSSEPAIQIIGKHSFQAFWKRHLRWGRIRKAHAPIPFLFEPLTDSFVVAFLGATAFQHFHWLGFGSVFFGTLGLWFFTDFLQFVRLGEPSLMHVLSFPFAWILRESLAIPLWLQISSSNSIEWRGNRFQLAQGGLISEDRMK